MSVTSQDATTTVIYKKDQMGDMPMMEESKGQETVPIEVGDDDLIFIGGNKDISQEDGTQLEIKLSDLKVVGTLGQGASGFVEKCFYKPTKTRIALKRIPVDSSDVVKK